MQTNAKSSFVKHAWFQIQTRPILLALIVSLILMTIINPMFMTLSNAMEILRETAFLGVASIGMTFVIATGCIDLSAGSLIALTAGITVLANNAWGPIGLLVGLFAGAMLGLINGCLVVFGRIPAFIATLCTLKLYRSTAYIILNEKAVQCTFKWFTQISNGNIGIIPYCFVIMVICLAIGWLLLKKTSFGKHILAVGNSQRAAWLSGINVGRTILFAFLINGIFTGLNAILVASRIWNAIGAMQDGYEFNMITSVVLGGTALSGGKGDVLNTVLASMFLSVLLNVMNLYGVNTYFQNIIKGCILLGIFSINGIRASVETRMRRRRLQNAQAALSA